VLILQKRKQKITKHHLKNKCQGGRNTSENILYLFEKKHEAWHLLFKNADLDEAISILQRVKQIKKSNQ
jgi:hypothetical protein